MTESSAASQAWLAHRPYLVNLAYQMLGDIGEAEDVAQDSYLRLAGTDLGEINDVRAWLTVVAGRLCLDRVRSARARREQPGLPLGDSVLNQSGEVDPADRVTLDEQVSDALLLVLHRLGPGERVAFVLHDIFEIPFDEVARTVGRPVGTCRQLASRARAKIHAARPRVVDVSAHEHQVVIDKFIAACATGDIGALAAVLDPDVWGVGAVLARPAPPAVLTRPAPPAQVNFGPTAVATNLLRYLGPGVTLVGGPVGEPVLFAYAERRLFAVITLTVRHRRIVKIEAIADPAARGPG